MCPYNYKYYCVLLVMLNKQLLSFLHVVALLASSAESMLCTNQLDKRAAVHWHYPVFEIRVKELRNQEHKAGAKIGFHSKTIGCANINELGSHAKKGIYGMGANGDEGSTGRDEGPFYVVCIR